MKNSLDTITKEYVEGKVAFSLGEKCTTNPYKTLTAFDVGEIEKYKDWLDGWLSNYDAAYSRD